MSTKQALAPPFSASSTAFLRHSMCFGSRCTLTRAAHRKRLAAAIATSRSRAVAVSAGRLRVPAKPAPKSAPPSTA